MMARRGKERDDQGHALARIDAIDPGDRGAVRIEHALHRVGSHPGDLAALDAEDESEGIAERMQLLVLVIVRERAAVMIEAALPAGSEVPIVLKAAHDVLPLDLGDGISNVLRPRASNLYAEVGSGGH